ncbi:DUF998 domain-containing protein [Microbispora sp. NEAU-D428]|nr:DUF998 domain-containing protein [Microbispora sitophila]
MGMVLGYVLVATGAVAMFALHLVAGLDPLTAMISEYVFAPHGWLLPVSLTSIAAGSAVLAVRLARLDRRAALLVGVWSACLLLVAGFPTDRPGLSLSLSGGIHRYAAFAAFVSLPVAGLLVARTTRSRLVRVLCAVALGSLLLVVLPYAFRMLHLDPGTVPAGLTQRLTVVSEVAALVSMSVSAARSAAAALVGEGACPDLVGVAHPGLTRPGVDPEDGHVVDARRADEVERDLVLSGPVDHLDRGVGRQGEADGAPRLVGRGVVEAQPGFLAAPGDERDRAVVGGQRPRHVGGHDLGRDDVGQLAALGVVDAQPGGVLVGALLHEDG